MRGSIPERFVRQLTEFIFVEHQPEKADIIFIPGNVCSEVPEYAAQLYRIGMVPYVLPSGRYSITTGAISKPSGKYADIIQRYEINTEWEFMSTILKLCGVPKDRILKENRATYTYENAIYSRQLTDEIGLKIKKAIICCQAYHSRRCLLYYQLLYPDTTFLICPVVTKGIAKHNWYLEEGKINRVLGEVERCGSQFRKIMKEFL